MATSPRVAPSGGSTDREILTVNAALGKDELPVGGVWVEPPDVPRRRSARPASCPSFFRNTIMDSIEVRTATGRILRGDGRHAGQRRLGACGPGARVISSPSAATLAIVGDYVSGAVSQPDRAARHGPSLDNTLRMVQLKPTEWVLCDIRIHALVGGYGQGIAFLWSESGDLLATASQSIAVKLWPGDAVLPG